VAGYVARHRDGLERAGVGSQLALTELKLLRLRSLTSR
jgi:hypothetical protein